MAGGKGMRLRPLTYKTPKPLLIVNGRSIIEQIISIAKRQGINKFYISIHYLGHKIKKFLGIRCQIMYSLKWPFQIFNLSFSVLSFFYRKN